MSGSHLDRCIRLAACVLVLCAIVAASLAFYKGTQQYLYLKMQAFLLAEVLLAYVALMGALSFSRHPRMSGLGIAILLTGTSILSLAGVEIFARSVAAGFPDPNTAAHMAIFIYPMLLTAGAIITLLFALLVSSLGSRKQVGTPSQPAEESDDDRDGVE